MNPRWSGRRARLDWLRRHAARGDLPPRVPRVSWTEVRAVAAELGYEDGPPGAPVSGSPVSGSPVSGSPVSGSPGAGTRIGATDPWPPGPGSAREGPLRRRLDEALVAVHRSEQTQLLMEASALRVARAGGAPRWLGPAAFGPDWEGRRPHDHWRGRVAEELALAHEDGVAVPVELVACFLWPPRLWGAASGEALARAALELEPLPEGRLALARAQVARGRVEEALVGLDRAQAEPALDLVPRPRRFRRGLDLCRGAAFERRGNPMAALANLSRALEDEVEPGDLDPTGDPSTGGPSTGAAAECRAFLEGVTLALALVAGDVDRARRALERVGNLVPPPTLEPVLGSRVPLWRDAFEPRHPPTEACARLLFPMLFEGSPLARRVALRVIS